MGFYEEASDLIASGRDLLNKLEQLVSVHASTGGPVNPPAPTTMPQPTAPLPEPEPVEPTVVDEMTPKVPTTVPTDSVTGDTDAEPQ